jgi:hypothetical protein
MYIQAFEGNLATKVLPRSSCTSFFIKLRLLLSGHLNHLLYSHEVGDICDEKSYDVQGRVLVMELVQDCQTLSQRGSVTYLS